MKAQSIILASLMSCVFFFIGCNEGKGTGKNNGNEFVPQTITPILIAQGEFKGQSGTKQNLVIKTQEEWDKLVTLITTKNSVNNVSNNFTEMEIDFSTYQIIAVFDEVKNNDGWSIDITDVIEFSDSIVVSILNLKKGDDTYVATQPYHIVKIPVSEKKIVFQQEKKQVECGRIDISENEYATMQVIRENNAPPKLRIENHTKEDLRYGSEFSLEYFNENEWSNVPLDIYNWTLTRDVLFAGKTIEEQINLSSYVKGYNKTKRGKYRIIKHFDCSYGTYNLCAEFSYNPEYKCGRFIINENEYVTMQVIPEKLSMNTPHTLRLENHTKGVLNYGTPFLLEYFNGTDWVSIQLDFEWTMNLLGLGTGETTEGKANFYSLNEYNNGKKGRYRIIKEFSVSYNFPFPSKGDHYFNLCAEFEIE